MADKITSDSLNNSETDKRQDKDDKFTDHVCERSYDDVLSLSNGDNDKHFTCGGCDVKLVSICRLHEHILSEFSTGSYIYDHPSRTAYCKVKSVSIGTQTEEIEVETFECDVVQIEALPTKKKKQSTKEKRKKSRKATKKKVSPKDKRKKLETTEKTSKKVTKSKKKIKDENEASSHCDKDLSDADKTNVENNSMLDDYYGDSTDEESYPYQGNHSNDDMISDAVDTKQSEKTEGKEIIDKKDFDLSLVDSIEVKRTKRSSKNFDVKVEDNSDDYVSDSKTNLMDVISERSGKPKTKKIKLQCEHCESSFKSDKKLNVHITNSHGQIYPYTCIPCNRKPFKTKEEYQRHKDQHPVQIYTCELCGKELKSKEGLRLHVLAHSGVKPYLCDQCDYRGRTSAQLKQHKFNHMDTKTEQCEHCGKAFFTKTKLREHIRYCRKEFNHHCSYCQKGFPTASGLRKHVLMHTGERAFVCDVCGFATFRGSLLKSHMRTHTGEKPFKCKFCGAKLASRGTLRLHERTHTHEKPFVCTFCNKAFTSKWNLKTHLRQHTGETPYKCDICGQGFKQNVLRKSHMRCHMETHETSLPNVHIDNMDTGATTLHRVNETPNMEMSLVVREQVMVEQQQQQQLLETSHTPVNIVQDHYNHVDTETHVSESVHTSELKTLHGPLDLKLHYTSGDYKNLYNPVNSVISATSHHTVPSNSFNMINYSN
ncbi:hypothetical protein ACF0H5_012630 [Mactra antiquata]